MQEVVAEPYRQALPGSCVSRVLALGAAYAPVWTQQLIRWI